MNEMFDKSAIDAAMEENKQEQKKLKQKLVPRGFQLMKLKEIKLDRTKPEKGAHPMFVITVHQAQDEKEEFKDISTYLVIKPDGLKTKSGMNLNLFQAMMFFVNCFGHKVTEPNADDPYGDLESQFKDHEGKEFRTIVVHKKELTQKFKPFMKAEIILRRCTHKDDLSLNKDNVDPKDCFTDLNPKDRAILEGKIIPGQDNMAKDDAFGTPKIGDDDDTETVPF